MWDFMGIVDQLLQSVTRDACTDQRSGPLTEYWVRWCKGETAMGISILSPQAGASEWQTPAADEFVPRDQIRLVPPKISNNDCIQKKVPGNNPRETATHETAWDIPSGRDQYCLMDRRWLWSARVDHDMDGRCSEPMDVSDESQRDAGRGQCMLSYDRGILTPGWFSIARFV